MIEVPVLSFIAWIIGGAIVGGATVYHFVMRAAVELIEEETIAAYLKGVLDERKRLQEQR